MRAIWSCHLINYGSEYVYDDKIFTVLLNHYWKSTKNKNKNHRGTKAPIAGKENHEGKIENYIFPSSSFGYHGKPT